jgi:ATP-binding protein involved in chromosome partitioning
MTPIERYGIQIMSAGFLLGEDQPMVLDALTMHLDGKKSLQHYRQAGVPILGGIENMSRFLCPHCGEPSELFAPVLPSRSIWETGVDKLGAIPWDAAIFRAGDSGRPLLIAEPDSPQANAFRQMAQVLAERLESTGK